ncbi:MAG: hypothetical protein ACTSVY_02850 [Candidatus Helarchaeota archaeon]
MKINNLSRYMFHKHLLWQKKSENDVKVADKSQEQELEKIVKRKNINV